MTVSPAPIPARHEPHRLLVAVMALVALAAIGVVLVLASIGDDPSGSRPVLGSGVAATETRAVAPFTTVELSGANVVTIEVGAPQSVVVQADDNVLENVTTEVRAARLVVGTTGSFTSITPMSVAITVPSLDGLTLSGTGSVVADGVRGPALDVALPGTGRIRATGRVDRLDARLSGSGELRLGGVHAESVRAVLSGTGRIVVTAHGTLDASIPGTGAIEYAGHPELTRRITGTGTIAGR
jgi:hypothetical protein